MKFKILSTVALMTIAFVTPVKAENQPTTTAQTQLNQRQILEACVQNRAETLPNPFSDVSADDWAFKAVLTMHYCGAFRQATPPNLVDRLVKESESREQS
ncbi:hypothetical protein [Phormidesmis priestleyi]